MFHRAIIILFIELPPNRGTSECWREQCVSVCWRSQPLVSLRWDLMPIAPKPLRSEQQVRLVPQPPTSIGPSPFNMPAAVAGVTPAGMAPAGIRAGVPALSWAAPAPGTGTITMPGTIHGTATGMTITAIIGTTAAAATVTRAHGAAVRGTLMPAPITAAGMVADIAVAATTAAVIMVAVITAVDIAADR